MPSPRISKLLAEMTIAEKIGQLGIFADAFRPFAADFNPETLTWSETEMAQMIRDGEVGSMFNGVGAVNGLKAQKIAVEESRLGIPMLLAADVIHGMRTVFPIPLAESASFNTGLAEATARACAVEATAEGLHWTFAPMVDVARDQRWGRVAETAGEDTHLVTEMARARVRGFQGPDLTATDSLLATPKHFAAYGAVAAGMDYNSVDISLQTLRDVHLPPFKASFEEGALSVMSAFNDINGVPCTANRALLKDLLRDEWKFTGLVVSDYTSDMELIDHGFAVDYPDAAAKSLNAGLDISMQSAVYRDGLPVALENGTVDMATLDQAVLRVLHVKEALGLFDNPYRSLDPSCEENPTWITAHTELALKAAEQSAVLLRNQRDVLPLRANAKIALMGPFADSPELNGGCWNLFGDASRNVGIRGALAETSLDVVTVAGCDIESVSDAQIDEAIQVASSADVAILCLGEPIEYSGEAQSKVSIAIPSAQVRLIRAVAATGIRTVVVLQCGRALAIDEWVDDVDSVLVSWFLGTQMGTAVANLLTGKVNPSGRLPVSFPSRDGQQPYFYNHASTGRPYRGGAPEYRARWREAANDALFPFGFGLTYSNIEYSAPRLSAGQISTADQLQVAVTLKNPSPHDATEVVQLYVQDVVASRVRPVRELKTFARIELKAGESREVTLELSPGQLSFHDSALQKIVEPGTFRVWLAPHSNVGESIEFVLQA